MTHDWLCTPDTYNLFREYVEQLQRLSATLGEDSPEYRYYADRLKGLPGFPKGVDPLADTIRINHTPTTGRVFSTPRVLR